MIYWGHAPGEISKGIGESEQGRGRKHTGVKFQAKSQSDSSEGALECKIHLRFCPDLRFCGKF